MEKKSFEWTSSSSHQLYGHTWSVDHPKGVVALVHGHGEHCHRYDGLAKHFNDQGWTVVGYDQVGHGRSGGKRGHIASVQFLLDDIVQLIGRVAETFPGLPIILYGHSMGGNLVLTETFKNKPEVNGVVVTSPWIRLAFEPPAWKITLGKVVRNIFPGLSQSSDLDAGFISRVPEEVAAYREDPLIHDKITPGLGMGIMDQGEWLHEFKGNTPLPLLIMHGSGDKITSFSESKALAERVGGDVTFKAWEDQYHELHHEKDPATVLNFALTWMESKI